MITCCDGSRDSGAFPFTLFTSFDVSLRNLKMVRLEETFCVIDKSFVETNDFVKEILSRLARYQLSYGTTFF